MTPPLPSRLGKISHRKAIDGRPLVYTVIDEIKFVASSSNGKAFYVQKLQFEDRREEFRICYYMIAHRPRMRGKWAYGQFAPMMTKEEMRAIFQKITDKGWI